MSTPINNFSINIEVSRPDHHLPYVWTTFVDGLPPGPAQFSYKSKGDIFVEDTAHFTTMMISVITPFITHTLGALQAPQSPAHGQGAPTPATEGEIASESVTGGSGEEVLD